MCRKNGAQTFAVFQHEHFAAAGAPFCIKTLNCPSVLGHFDPVQKL
jgi:hypothetical protein